MTLKSLRVFACFVGAVAGSLGAAGRAGAVDDGTPQDQPAAVQLTVSPQGEPAPALKYTLLPQPEELHSGDATVFYYRAVLLLPRDSKFTEENETWLERPLAELPRQDIRKWLAPFQNAMNEVRRGALCQSCSWDLHIDQLEGLQPIELLLPEMQEFRMLARVLAIQARLQAADGNYDEAIATLRVGYRAASDVARPKTLINDLIAIAMDLMFNRVVQDLITAPESPNLYWALASLPRPVINLAPAMRTESDLPFQMFPFLRHAETLDWTAERWGTEWAQALMRFELINDHPGLAGGGPSWRSQLAATGVVLWAYPQARQDLLRQGFSAQQLEAMPAAKVVAISTARDIRHDYDEAMKWTLLPYWQAEAPMRATYDRIGQDWKTQHATASRIAGAVVGMLLPSVQSATFASVRLDRDVNAYMVIEALRAHAAAHEGKLPATLEEITDTPAPLDPVTGKPFHYHADGNRAVLDVPAPPRHPGAQFGKRFQITMQSR